MGSLRHASSVVAALVVASIGFFLLAGSPRIGLLLFAVGGGAALWQAWRLFSLQRERERYDLSRLWERTPPADPDENAEEGDPAAVEDDGTLYCHSCGHAVPAAFHKCPECGRPLT